MNNRYLLGISAMVYHLSVQSEEAYNCEAEASGDTKHNLAMVKLRNLNQVV